MSINLHSLFLIETPETPASTGANRQFEDVKAILMRKLTWLVIISYTLLLFKPVMPVVMDVMAHTFWEKQHLATVHEVNGKFHLHYELVKASHQSDKEKQGVNNKFEIAEYIPVRQINAVYGLSEIYRERDFCHCYNCFYTFLHTGIDTPPPKA